MSITVILVLVAYLVLWQGYQVRTRSSTFGQFALLAALAAILTIPIVVQLRDVGVFGELDRRWVRLIGNLVVLVACLSIYLFRLSVENHTLRSAPVQRALAGAAAVSAYLAAVTAYAVRNDLPLSPDYSGGPVVASFFAVADGYFGVLVGAVAIWMLRLSRGLHRDLKLGLRVASVSLFLVAA